MILHIYYFRHKVEMFLYCTYIRHYSSFKQFTGYHFWINTFLFATKFLTSITCSVRGLIVSMQNNSQNLFCEALAQIKSEIYKISYIVILVRQYVRILRVFFIRIGDQKEN